MKKEIKSLMIILGILGVLFIMGIFIPTSHPVTTASRRSYCLSNMKLIGSCLGMYANNNRSPTRKLFSSEEYACFPEISGDRGLLRIYKDGLENKKVYKCLGDGKSQKTFWEKTFGNSPEPGNSEFKSDYIYLGGFAKQENPAVPILFDKIGNHEDYCNVLFSDGQPEYHEFKFSNYHDLINEINKKKNYSQQTIDRIKASLKQALENNKAVSEKAKR